MEGFIIGELCAVSSGLIQQVSTIFQMSIDFKKKRMQAFQ
jgi:hypothetical protein